MKKFKAMLFDLDGTLLPMNMDEFMNGYFKELIHKIDYDIDSETFKNYIWKSTKDVIKNLDENKFNQEVFFESFSKLLDDDLENYKYKFDDFYIKHFSVLKKYTKPHLIVKDIIKYLKKNDVKLVVATNPVFPKEAIYQRIEWAGLDPKDFELITSYENMHFTKPNVEYYKEILDNIKVDAKDSMMIGNDIGEDIISSKIGISTYYIDTFGIDRDIKDLKPDYRGSLEDFYEYIKKVYRED